MATHRLGGGFAQPVPCLVELRYTNTMTVGFPDLVEALLAFSHDPGPARTSFPEVGNRQSGLASWAPSLIGRCIDWMVKLGEPAVFYGVRRPRVNFEILVAVVKLVVVDVVNQFIWLQRTSQAFFDHMAMLVDVLPVDADHSVPVTIDGPSLEPFEGRIATTFESAPVKSTHAEPVMLSATRFDVTYSHTEIIPDMRCHYGSGEV